MSTNIPQSILDKPSYPVPPTPISNVASRIDARMRRIFFQLGWFVAAHPLKLIPISLLFTLATLSGLVRFRSETRASQLWIPQSTVAVHNSQYVEAHYGRTVLASSILFVATTDTPNLATKQAMLQMLDVAEEGFRVTAAPIHENGADGTVITFPERCIRTADRDANSLCRSISAFNLFYDHRLVVRADDGSVDFFATVRAGLQSMDDATVRNILENQPSATFDLSPFNAEETFGGVSGSGDSFSVSAMRYIQLVENNGIQEGGSVVDKEARDLEEQWVETLLETTPLLQTTSIKWFVENKFTQLQALARSLSDDLPLLSIGFALLTIYVVLFLGDFHAIRSHMLLAIAALITPGLALAACFGISSALGMFYGPVHQVLPLVVIGIGIDDCFHITRAADDINGKEHHADKPTRLKVALAISASGSAITVTSFTNVVVFLVSSVTKLPALRYFTLWAAIGVFFAWAFALTFYTAFVTLDMRRVDSKRRDCCPCFRPVEEVKELNWFKKRPGGFSRFFGETFGPFITGRVVRFIILILFMAALGVCGYATSRLYLNYQFSFFYPDGSAIREFQDAIDEYYELGAPTDIYIRERDLSDVDNQKRLLELCDTNGVLANNEWLQSSSIDCWYTQMRQANSIEDGSFIDSGVFTEMVERFISSGSGARYRNDIIISSSNDVIGCRIGAQYIHRATNNDEIDALRSVREAADSVGFGNDDDGFPAAFPYVFLDTFTEQYNVLPKEMAISLSVAIGVVALVCFVLVGDVLVAGLCMVVVGMIVVDMLGLMNLSGINLNSVSVFTLVLSIGFAVDFVVHIVRSFLEQVGSRRERAIKALVTMGPPVFYAGFSTFLAIAILAFAKSYVFQVMFRGLTFLIALGFLHSLVLCPVVLSLIGPSSIYASEKDRSERERELERRVEAKLLRLEEEFGSMELGSE